LDTLLSNSNPLRQSFLYLIVATFIIFRNKYHRPNNEMAQLFNHTIQMGNLAGKARRRRYTSQAPPQPGKIIAHTWGSSQIHDVGEGKPPITTIMTRCTRRIRS
jgi:hypothetical protein